MRPNGTRFLALTAAASAAAMILAACSSSGSGSSSSSSGSPTKSPILIGTSLSLTGDFSADGQAFERGYKLWVKEINKSGGLLGHKVTLKIVNDNSDPGTVTTNYTQLISADHAAFMFGPFSTLLTAPAAQVAARYHYAFIEGAGGGPSVFALQAAQPVRGQPGDHRPAGAVRQLGRIAAGQPAAEDRRLPDGGRPVRRAHGAERAGDPPGKRPAFKTVYSKVFPAENPAYKAGADAVAHKKPDMVVIGSPDVPGVQSVMQAFMQQHYTPKILAASAGRTRARRSCPRSAAPRTPPAPWCPTAGTPVSTTR